MLNSGNLSVMMVGVAADLRQGLNVPSTCVCWPPPLDLAEWKWREQLKYQMIPDDGHFAGVSCVCLFWVSTFLPVMVTAAWRHQQPRHDPSPSQRGSAAWTQILNALIFFFPPPLVDKEGCSLLGNATFPLSQEHRCKVQPCKAKAIFYIYQLSKETAGLAVCWQRQSTPFLYSTSPPMFTGTKQERRWSVICLWSEFKDLKDVDRVHSECREENMASVVIPSVYKHHHSMFTCLLLA